MSADQCVSCVLKDQALADAQRRIDDLHGRLVLANVDEARLESVVADHRDRIDKLERRRVEAGRQARAAERSRNALRREVEDLAAILDAVESIGAVELPSGE